VALNAADEVAVTAFLEGKISFSGIPAIIQAVLNETPAGKPESISEVLGMDSEARELARRFVNTGASGSRVAATK
jgi:1-deoxy-D-xylulose-5-phosphate reductoisomerase